jgi:hypothetical protein
MASRRIRSLGAWMFAGLFSGSVAACLIAPESATGPCTSDKTCDDDNPCTTDTCAGDGFCDHVAFDAHPADGDDCTDDLCNGVEEAHPLKANGAPCGANGALACQAGLCQCTQAAQCGMDNTCVTQACTNSVCKPSFAPKDTAVDNGDDHDCKKRVCDGAGGLTAQLDAADAPLNVDGDCHKVGCAADGSITDLVDPTDIPADDMNECTTEGCNADGTVILNAHLTGTPCGNTGCGGTDPSFSTAQPSTCMDGTCPVAASTPCGLFDCKADLTACRDTCDQDEQCTTAAYCSQSTCKPKIDDGGPCSNSNQCKNGHCSDEHFQGGICCNTACEGKCEACLFFKTGQPDGTCADILDKTDPDKECDGMCQWDGQGCCDGEGDCH